METFSALLAICAENSPVTGKFSAQRPVTRSFDVLFDLRLNNRLSKQSWGWWFETQSRPLWRHCSVLNSISLMIRYSWWLVSSPDFLWQDINICVDTWDYWNVLYLVWLSRAARLLWCKVCDIWTPVPISIFIFCLIVFLFMVYLFFISPVLFRALNRMPGNFNRWIVWSYFCIIVKSSRYFSHLLGVPWVNSFRWPIGWHRSLLKFQHGAR